jgi:hypothetical protein
MKNKNTNTKTFTLDENFDPQILKTLSYEELTLLEKESLNNAQNLVVIFQVI